MSHCVTIQTVVQAAESHDVLSELQGQLLAAAGVQAVSTTSMFPQFPATLGHARQQCGQHLGSLGT